MARLQQKTQAAVTTGLPATGIPCARENKESHEVL
jgi:hypothetical protein